MHVYSFWQTVDVFLNVRHSCLDCSSFFFTNALHVWESMVLRIGKEEPTSDLCAAMIEGSVYVRWQLCCSEAVIRCAHETTCCYAGLRSSCLKLFACDSLPNRR